MSRERVKRSESRGMHARPPQGAAGALSATRSPAILLPGLRAKKVALFFCQMNWGPENTDWGLIDAWQDPEARVSSEGGDDDAHARHEAALDAAVRKIDLMCASPWEESLKATEAVNDDEFVVDDEVGGAQAPSAEEPPVPDAAARAVGAGAPKGSERGKSQYFTFTQHLGADEAQATAYCRNYDLIIKDMYKEGELGFFSGGLEKAPETGQWHIQGYMESPEGKRWTFKQFHGLRCFIGAPKTPWVKASRGSAEQNVDYTGKAKDEGRWYLVIGEFRNYGQGKSKEMVAVQKKLDAKVNLSSIYKTHFETSAKHYRFFNEYRRVAVNHERPYPEVWYLYGPTGTGKSRFCMEKWGGSPENVYWLPLQKAGNNVWWDGYQGQETVIIDDFYPGYFGRGHCTFMLRMCDRYPFQVPVHGGQVPFYSKRIVFTSNTPIDEIDSEEYSGYPWNDTNPLFNRVYRRDPPWRVVPMLDPLRNEPRPPAVPPAVNDQRRERIVVLKDSDASRRAAERLADATKRNWKKRKTDLLFQ